MVRHLPPSFLTISNVDIRTTKVTVLCHFPFDVKMCNEKRERKTVGAGEKARESLYSRLEVFGLIYGGTGGSRHWSWREYGQPSKVRSKRYREIGGHRFYILKLICSRKDLR